MIFVLINTTGYSRYNCRCQSGTNQQPSENINRNILRCTGNILYHKFYNEKGLAPTYVKTNVPSTSLASLLTNKNNAIKE